MNIKNINRVIAVDDEREYVRKGTNFVWEDKELVEGAGYSYSRIDTMSMSEDMIEKALKEGTFVVAKEVAKVDPTDYRKLYEETSKELKALKAKLFEMLERYTKATQDSYFELSQGPSSDETILWERRREGKELLTCILDTYNK